MSIPRVQSIYIGCTERFDRVDKGPGYFELPDDGKTYYIFQRRQYARAKKPKVVYALFQFFGSRRILINPEAELQKYSRVFAQDTNYKKVAVTTLCEARRSALSGVYSAHIVDTWTFLPKTTTPEREAWLTTIERLDLSEDGKYCLIVDSDLSSLQKMNRGEVPVLPNRYLPLNWQLNYATSDVRDDFIASRLMRKCDKTNRAQQRKMGKHA